MKQDDKLKQLFKDHIEEEYEKLSSSVIAIFMYGFMCGIIFAYSNLAPLTIGMAGGYAIAKQNYQVVNYAITKMTDYMTVTWETGVRKIK